MTPSPEQAIREAVQQAETVMMIVEPRSHKREYLKAMFGLRHALPLLDKMAAEWKRMRAALERIREEDQHIWDGGRIIEEGSLAMIARTALTDQEAPLAVRCPQCDFGIGGHEPGCNATPAPSSKAAPVAIKPLTWSEPTQEPRRSISRDDGGIRTNAETIVGRYSVQSFDQNKTFYAIGTRTGGAFDTLEAAKSVAQADYEARVLSALAHPAHVPKGHRLVPISPTAEQWGGLARDVVMWTRLSGRPTGKALHEHLDRLGRNVPDWLLTVIPPTDQVPAKGSVAYAIYRLMVEALPAAPQPGGER